MDDKQRRLPGEWAVFRKEPGRGGAVLLIIKKIELQRREAQSFYTCYALGEQNIKIFLCACAPLR
jgi:hypothetical protein